MVSPGTIGAICDFLSLSHTAHPFLLRFRCDKFDDHLFKVYLMIQLPVDVGLLMIYPWDDEAILSLHAQIISDPYGTWSRHGSRGSGYSSSGPAWQCTRPQHALFGSENPAVPGW